MTTYSRITVMFSDDGRCCRVSLNRPPVNALDDVLIDELASVAAHLTTRSDLRAVVLTSDDDVFMVGMDLGVMGDSWDRVADLITRFQSAVTAWEKIPATTVAALPGHALGAGCELALACDLRIMVRGRARIGLPEVKRALIPAGGGTQRMLRTVGLAAARELCLLGRLLPADRAEALGLVTLACEVDQLESSVSELVDELVALPPLTMAAIKRCLIEGNELPLSEGLAVEMAEMVSISATSDAREGVQSFLDRREPEYTGV